jgi:hypothetical protein
MISTPRWNVVVPSLAAPLASLVVTGAPARAQVVKPFRITGQGGGPLGLPLPGQPARPHEIAGQATHLNSSFPEILRFF